MGFSTSTGASRQSIIGQVVWGSKNPDLPLPNIRFYDKDAKQESYLVPIGTRAQAKVSGVITRFSIGQVPSYQDKEQNTGETNLFRAYLTLDGGADEPLAVLAFDVFDRKAEKVDSNSLQLINSVASHLEAVQRGELPADAPVEIGFYRKPNPNNKDKPFPASIIRLPSEYDEAGTPVFGDAKNFVRSESLPPRGVPMKKPDGQPLLVNGQQVYDHSEAIAWVEGKIGVLLEAYKKEDATAAEKDAQTAAGATDAPAADLSGVAEDAVAAAQRQRASA
ncbi:hypothetical protein [Achromobacter anxifer]|uniref:hypothetical protein n=1 Tax=Achromobacter anxifer TaxID=1287737 RepID=UPI0023F7AF0B|nr:hypothetical protein [Achromobacter anxifer]MDF8359458.1 hypothetical protein [Achromobacter anxifer]